MWSLFGRGGDDRKKRDDAEITEDQRGAAGAALDSTEHDTEVLATTAVPDAPLPDAKPQGVEPGTRTAAAVDSAAPDTAERTAAGAATAIASQATAADAATAGGRAAQETEPEPDFTAIHTAWRQAAHGLGGRNPLLFFNDAPQNRIDLSTTHPSGLAQFITGQKILLSALIRDEVALRKAKQAAGRVTDKAIEMRNMRGLDTVHLGVGIATWTFEGDSFTAPVLLRPLAIRRYGRDFEIKLKGGSVVNPDLVRILRAQYGLVLDAASLVELSQSEGVFKPQPVIDRLRQMAAGIPGFTVEPRLVASSFSSVAHRMERDMVDLDTPILRAICGDNAAAKELRNNYHPVTPTHLDNRAPETDCNLYDADTEQDDVISQVAAGYSLVVHTMPGTGGTQTVVNAIGELVRRGKRVLVVSPRNATIEGIAHRFERVDLPGMITTPRRLRRSLVEAISRNEQSQPHDPAAIDKALVNLRRVLVDYRDALDAPDAKLGVSPLEALRELAKLSLLPDAPRTTVRLSQKALNSLALDRSSVADALTEVARLGQFQYGPEDSPWYGVTFATTEEARKTYARAVDVSETKLARLNFLAHELLEQTSLKPYETLYELGIYLRLLTGIGQTLDRFKPEVYDHRLTEVIAALGPRGVGEEMSAAQRRSRKKLAREFVRPGVTVTDMHARLVEIQQQQALWQRYCTVHGTRPELPLGLGEVTAAFEGVYEDIEALDRVLGTADEATKLRNLPLPQLARKLAELAEASEVLQNIQERTAIIERLRDADLADLFADLSARHVPAEAVALELEQAWWQTALEHMLAHNQALLGANIAMIERIESDFRLVDDAHAHANGKLLAAQLADVWKLAVIDNREEGHALRDALRRGSTDPAALLHVAPNLVSALAPVWAMSPYEVSLLPADIKFDAVILVDAAAISLVEATGAIRRAAQVVAFGDPVIQVPSAFNLAVTDADYPGDSEISETAQEEVPESAYAALKRVLPQLALTRSYRAGGADLTDLVNTKFYSNSIATLPWAGTFLGRSSLTREFVRSGQGLPDSHTGAVESTDAEVERVVQLVLEHASERPNESLMVITASRKHSVRVWQSVLSYFARFPEHRDFLLGDHAEPFTVVTLEQATALSRDRVIFSIGYGRTPHGRVLSNFGPLSRPGGQRLIAVAMTRARRAMTIVSCFSAEHLEGVQGKYGVPQLAAVIGAETKPQPPKELPAEADSMVTELADRLAELGLKVALNYQGVIPIAASLGSKAIAVDVDFSSGEDSMRHTLRLRPAVLRRLGWHYQRVQSFDLFQNPEEVALRIAEIIGYDPVQAQAAAVAVDPAQITANITEQGLKLSDDQDNITQVIEPLPTLPQPTAADGIAEPVKLDANKLGSVTDTAPRAPQAPPAPRAPEAPPSPEVQHDVLDPAVINPDEMDSGVILITDTPEPAKDTGAESDAGADAGADPDTGADDSADPGVEATEPQERAPEDGDGRD